MLSTDPQHRLTIERIARVVANLREERPLFKEELDYERSILHLANLLETNLSIEDFQNLSDLELKKRCSAILSTELIAGMLDDLTPEELAIFEKAVQRK